MHDGKSFRRSFQISTCCTVGALLLISGVGYGQAARRAARQPKTFTYFESFENALENSPQDPRDLNGNGIIDCGADIDCATITPCNVSPTLCDEWTLPLVADADLRLPNEDSSGDKISFKNPAGASLPAARGGAEVVAPGSTVVCPAIDGFPPAGIRPDLLDWHIHTFKTPDIDGIDTSRPGTQPKAFRGQNSLHWGRHILVPNLAVTTYGDAYCLQCMNAFVLDRPGGLNLSRRATPEQPHRLSFWHIAEYCDQDCYTGFDPGTADDFSIVEVRSAPRGSSNFGPWERAVPVSNPYDGVEDTKFPTPTYEPPDDTNPLSADSPDVTMCAPLTVYMAQGSAKGTDPGCGDGDGDGFGDCGNVTSGTSRGEAGVGVWARTEIDLGRYANRRIQVRFISTTLDGRDLFTSYLETITGPFNPPSGSFDDGWYVDDIRVSGLGR